MQPVLEEGQELANLRLYNRILASALAGLAGGAAMLAVWLVAFASLGRSPWRPLQLAASSVMGDTAMLPSAGVGTAIVGCLIHAITSAGFGALFGVICAVRSTFHLIMRGLLFGALLALALQYIILPRAVSLAWALRMPLEVSLSAHLVFGLVTAWLILPLERRLITREFEERAEHPAIVVPIEEPRRSA